ncbi:MAG: hypothetical protein ACD_51C00316G0015 [uncultured bacterium]|nr:MAG: hypothetical protein ACD_51C00316G0015 [uncultured bacterium]OGJ47078.1 MAG: hypothetical protein A2244_05065 [Candidatus Peregrinibacteria bacterium RIFOXYA2_FULL_41_18]OGJ49766.1 MAG: hypothetical protein A2344_03725 [Candidatus Peregrinibacteria bacterium RIFOXYB12_FULL_41_12]OGJ52655.1 MAG: hypothetical protein A2448_00305 [Candidatus Peregrinibacteria bacterium RIFOXYC2_FULL_41_22]
MKFLSSKYITAILLTILGGFFAYDIYNAPLTAWLWVKSIIYMVIFVYVPGKIIAKRTGGPVVFMAGIIINLVLFIPAQYFGEISILLVPIFIANIYFLYDRFKNGEDDTTVENIAIINGLLAVLVIMSPNLVFNYSIGDLSALSNSLDGLDDIFFHLGKIEMFKIDFPIGDWSVYDFRDSTFKYHYFFHIWIAEISKLTGVETGFLYFRFFPYFITSAIFLAVAKLGYAITENHTKALASSFLATLGGGASVLLGIGSVIKYGGLSYLFAIGSRSFTDWIIESPTMALSMLFFIVLLYLLNKTENKLSYVLYLIGVIGLTGAKGSTALIYIGALFVYGILFFDKKFLLKIAIPSGFTFLIAYWMIYYGKESVNGGLGLYSFKDITWLGNSVGWMMTLILLGGYITGTIGIKCIGLLDKRKDKITRLIKIGFLLGTALFILSPLRWVNLYWFVPFSAVIGILIIDFVLEIKSKTIKNMLVAVIIIEICFGALYGINKGFASITSDKTKETHIEPEKYEAYKFIQENTDEDSVVWSMASGENRKNTFDCMVICSRQNLLEGWGFSPYMNYEELSPKDREDHTITKILEAEQLLLNADDEMRISEVLDGYSFVDYLIIPVSEIKNINIFSDSGLEAVFDNGDYIIYKTE